MRMLVGLLLATVLLGCADLRGHPQASSVSMRVVEYAEISDADKFGSRLDMWLLANRAGNLCFAVFGNNGATLSATRIECSSIGQ